MSVNTESMSNTLLFNMECQNSKRSKVFRDWLLCHTEKDLRVITEYSFTADSSELSFHMKNNEAAMQVKKIMKLAKTILLMYKRSIHAF